MTDSATPPPDLDQMRRTLRSAALVTSGAGIVYGVLTLLAWFLLEQDREAFASAPDSVAYIDEGGFAGATVAGLYLMPFAAIAFLWFIVALRGWIRGTRRRRNMLISDLQLVSGSVFTAIFLIGAGAVATPLIVIEHDVTLTSGDTLKMLASFGYALMDVMGVRIAGIFVIATASLGMTTSVLPRWFSLASYAFGLLLMIAPMVESPLILAFPTWVIAVSVILLYHVANVPTDSLPGFAARYARDGEMDELPLADE